jgi:cleavage and polyadenylation specificity factor subunit 1
MMVGCTTTLLRKLHVLGGARGIWLLPVRQSQRVNGLSYEKATGPFSVEIDTMIISTDANPMPGVLRVDNLFFGTFYSLSPCR